MPLVYSNLNSFNTPASNALNSKLNPSPLGPINASTLSVGGSNPAGLLGNATKVTAPVKSAPVAPLASKGLIGGSPGAYKGTAINPGTDAEVQSQIEAIDKQNGPSTASTGPVQTPQASGLVVQQPQAPATTYGGLVGSLAGTSAAGNQNATNYNTQTAAYGAGNIPIGEQAANLAKQYGQQIADVGGKGAQFEGGQLTTGTSPVASGNAAITAQTTAAQQQALASGETAALQGLGVQLTGQNQAANASNEAAGTANAQQGLIQSGLNSAAGLAQPSATSQGQTTFDPLTGTFTGGSYQGNLQTVVNAIKSGSMGYTNGVNSLSSLSPTAKADVLAALGPNFDTVSSDANASTRGSNIQTAGTTGTNIASQGATQATLAYNNLNAANSTFNNQASQVLKVLQDSSLNGSIPDVNKAINKLGGKLGNTQVQALSSSLTELAAAYTNLLSSNGGTPTAQDQQALAALSPNSSAAQIATSIQQLKAAADIKLQSARTLASGYGSNLGSTGGGSTGGSSGSTGTVVQTSAGPVNTGW